MSELKLTGAAVLAAILVATFAGAAHAMPVQSTQSVQPARDAASSSDMPPVIGEPDAPPTIDQAGTKSSPGSNSAGKAAPAKRTAKRTVKRKTRTSRRHRRIAQRQFAGRCGGYKRLFFRTRRHYWLAKYKRCKGWR